MTDTSYSETVLEQKDMLEERRHRRTLSMLFARTCAVAVLVILFLVGWTVIVQNKDLSEGVSGSLFHGIAEVLKVILS